MSWLISSLTVSGSIKPATTTTYDLGADGKRFNYVYGRYLNMSGDSTISGKLSVSGKLSGSTASFSGAVDFSNRANVPNGYLVVGGYSLVLGGEVRNLPTSTGYGIW